MTFGKRTLLVAFLEKDNVKLLAYEVSGKTQTRIFGGQISFPEDVVKDSFIADPAKFASQVKVALSQKGELAAITEGILFIPPEKTFIKSIPSSDSVETFVRSLPYFKEELVITPDPTKKPPVGTSGKTTYVAFEKKLVEDFERPFLDSGKKIVAVESSIYNLASSFAQTGKHFLIASFDKEVAVLAMEQDAVLEVATFGKDVLVGRFAEFRAGKNLTEVKQVFTLGVFDAATLDKLRAEQGVEVTSLAGGDIYDLVMSSSLAKGPSGPSLPLKVPEVKLGNLSNFALNKKYLFLGGAAIVGFVLALVVIRSLQSTLPNLFGNKDQVRKETPVKKEEKPKEVPPPAPEASPSAFKVRVLNGTDVAGEAKRLGEKLAEQGFVITETKNATASGFAASRIRITKDVPKTIVEKIKTVILASYESVSEEGMTDDQVEIEVIIGEKKQTE